MSILPVVLAFGSVWLGGALLLSACGLRKALHDDIALAFVTGAIVLYFLVVSQLIFEIRLRTWPYYAFVLTGGALWLSRTMRAGEVHRWRRPRGRIVGCLLAAAGLCVGRLLLNAREESLDWDGWAIWAFKAKVLTMDHGLPLAVLRARGPYAFPHAEYPIGLPILTWWSAQASNLSIGAVASLVGVLSFSILVLAMWNGRSHHVPDGVAAAMALGIAAFPTLSANAIGGYADHLVALALLGATIELARSHDGQSQPGLWRVAIFIAFGATVKDEGLALAVAFFVMTVFLPLLRPTANGRFLPLTVVVLAISPWMLIRLRNGISSRLTDQLVHREPLIGAALGTRLPSDSGSVLGSVIDRLPGFLNGLYALVHNVTFWPIPAIAVVGAYAALRTSDRGLLAPWLLIAAYVSLLTASYLLLGAEEIHWLMETSAQRVFGALVPAIVYLALHSASGLRVGTRGGLLLGEKARGI